MALRVVGFIKRTKQEWLGIIGSMFCTSAHFSGIPICGTFQQPWNSARHPKVKQILELYTSSAAVGAVRSWRRPACRRIG